MLRDHDRENHRYENISDSIFQYMALHRYHSSGWYDNRSSETFYKNRRKSECN